VDSHGTRRRYDDRSDAGRVLVEQLRSYAAQDPVVLAIPNGGVAVAIPIAEALDCPLHLIVVRKMKIPWNTEAGFGSVASDGTVLLNEPLVRRLRLNDNDINRQRAEAIESIQERLARYGPAAQFPELEGRTAILVDDGLASGLTMEAAVRVVKQHDPGKVVIAVPTASKGAYSRLLPLVHQLICPDVSGLSVFAVADAYHHWRDLEDDEVLSLLEAFRIR